MEIYTIGFTRHSAEDFFEILSRTGVTRLIDVRLNNVSQLAGFAKRDDLRYFLGRICGADYFHEPLFAPTQSLLDAYKKHKTPWAQYEVGFRQLMSERRVEERIPKSCSRESLFCCAANELPNTATDGWSANTSTNIGVASRPYTSDR